MTETVETMEIVWVQNLKGFVNGTFPADERWRKIFVEQLGRLNYSLTDTVVVFREALEEIAKTNQTREFMGDDKSDGYGNEGWVVRDGPYAKIARAALATTEGADNG